MPKKRDHGLIILFSGGADSILMLELAIGLKLKPHCVLVEYGQSHIEELNYACEYLTKRGITWDTVKIVGLNVDSGLTGDGVKGKYAGVNEMHVPSRNLMFVSIAASIAESKGIDTIWLGANWDDYLNRFEDCKQEWVGRVNKVLRVNGSTKIKLQAPLNGLSKEIITKILTLGSIDKSQYFSGYGDAGESESIDPEKEG
jgi:7-cyano-7-deazaguanine synthase